MYLYLQVRCLGLKLYSYGFSCTHILRLLEFVVRRWKALNLLMAVFGLRAWVAFSFVF